MTPSVRAKDLTEPQHHFLLIKPFWVFRSILGEGVEALFLKLPDHVHHPGLIDIIISFARY